MNKDWQEFKKGMQDKTGLRPTVDTRYATLAAAAKVLNANNGKPLHYRTIAERAQADFGYTGSLNVKTGEGTDPAYTVYEYLREETRGPTNIFAFYRNGVFGLAKDFATVTAQDVADAVPERKKGQRASRDKAEVTNISLDDLLK